MLINTGTVHRWAQKLAWTGRTSDHIDCIEVVDVLLLLHDLPMILAALPPLESMQFLHLLRLFKTLEIPFVL